MKNKMLKEITKKPVVETVMSTIKKRGSVGDSKKGVNLLGIVEKLSQKREKNEDESSDKSTE